MRAEHPGVLPDREPPGLEALPFFELLLTSPAFRQTRRAAPYLERYRRAREARSGGEPPAN